MITSEMVETRHLVCHRLALYALRTQAPWRAMHAMYGQVACQTHLLGYALARLCGNSAPTSQRMHVERLAHSVTVHPSRPTSNSVWAHPRLFVGDEQEEQSHGHTRALTQDASACMLRVVTPSQCHQRSPHTALRPVFHASNAACLLW